MKRFILSSVLIVLSAEIGLSQQLFQRVYGGNGYDEGAEVIELADGNFMIACSSGSYEPGMSSQIMLMKANETGHWQWQQTYGGQFADRAESMVQDIDGNFLIAGFTETIANSYQGYALKIDQLGDTIWTKKYGGAGWDFFKQALALSDGGFAIVGQTYSFGSGEGDVWLVRMDSNGDTLWTKTYGGVENDGGSAISFTSTGGFFLAGNTTSFGAGGQDVYMIKTDALGDTLWTRTYGGAEDEICHGSCTTTAGDLVVVGGSRSMSIDEYDFMIHKHSSDGDSLHSEIFDGSTDEFWTDVEEDSNQKLIVVGWVNDSGFGKIDFRYQRYNQTLGFDGIAASKGSAEDDKMFDVKPTTDGGYVMAGVTGGFLNRLDDVYLYKMGPQGEEAQPELGVEEIVVNGESFAVRFAPNPILENAALLIDGFDKIQQHYSGPITIDMYDGLGRKVASTRINSGNTPLDVSDLAAGIHHYQIISDGKLLATGNLIKAE